jgi:hypothetical protein
MGAIYIPAALAAGPLLRRLESRSATLSPKLILAALISLGGLAALIPPALSRLSVDPCPGIWITAVLYSISTGLMWPVVEWYLSGGRKHAALRSATGKFNITWTAAIVLCFWILFFFLERAPLDFLALLGGLHIAGLVIVAGLPTRPPPPLEHHEPHPPLYDRMLRVARRLLPISYLLMSALGPYFPGALTSLGVELRWQPVFASIWLVARVGAMTTLERWHGWHDKWTTLILGTTLLVAGFAGCVLAPVAQSLPLMAAALAAFGLGMGVIYTAALYYALEAGGHSADAGGTHEALIGFGYTAGPAIGLAAALAVESNAIPDSRFGLTIVIAATSACLLGYLIAARFKQNPNK